MLLPLPVGFNLCVQGERAVMSAGTPSKLFTQTLHVFLEYSLLISFIKDVHLWNLLSSSNPRYLLSWKDDAVGSSSLSMSQEKVPFADLASSLCEAKPPPWVQSKNPFLQLDTIWGISGRSFFFLVCKGEISGPQGERGTVTILMGTQLTGATLTQRESCLLQSTYTQITSELSGRMRGRPTSHILWCGSSPHTWKHWCVRTFIAGLFIDIPALPSTENSRPHSQEVQPLGSPEVGEKKEREK